MPDTKDLTQNPIVRILLELQARYDALSPEEKAKEDARQAKRCEFIYRASESWGERLAQDTNPKED
jgi:hypothetical protein